MFDVLAKLHAEGRLTSAALANAVTKGWISQVQADEITDSDGPVGVLT